MNILKGLLSEKNRLYLLCLSLLMLFLAVLLIVKGDKVEEVLEDNLVNNKTETTAKSLYETEAIKTINKRIEVMRVIHNSDVYKLYKSVDDGLTRVYKNEDEYAKSSYVANNNESAMVFNLEPFSIVSEDTGRTEGLKAVEEGLVYQITKEQTREYLQNFYNDGYTLDIQIATSVYNELYLYNSELESCYRVITVNGLDLTIISEVDYETLDIQDIMQITEIVGG